MAGSFAKIAGHGAVLDTSVLDRITTQLRPRARGVVEKYGLAITSTAAQLAPVDTSALRNSILSESKMTDDMIFTVYGATEYAVYVEFGTSRMAAQPFMTPAIEIWKERFQNAFAELFK